MKNLMLFVVACSVVFLGSCSFRKEKIAISSYKEYEQYLLAFGEETSQKINACDKEIAFWQGKLSGAVHPAFYWKQIAQHYQARFDFSGDINDITLADSLLRLAVDKTYRPIDKASLYNQLAALAITRHDFVEARYFAGKAVEEHTYNPMALLSLFDSYMELGRYDSASFVLDMTADTSSFDYIVRLAKYKDYKGNLDGAIDCMERANIMAVKAGNDVLTAWTRASLADYYGHAGRVEESYRSYLMVLEKNTIHRHSLEGIAWVAFSYDKNTADARQILSTIARHHQLPDPYLGLAELAEFEGDIIKKKEFVSTFYNKASETKYEGMYNKYLIKLAVEEFGDSKTALALAQSEVYKRPTPETYSWLAFAYCASHQEKQAVGIVKDYVEGKTFEPEALQTIGFTYKQAGENRKGTHFLKEALEASYELGPVATKQIEMNL